MEVIHIPREDECNLRRLTVNGDNYEAIFYFSADGILLKRMCDPWNPYTKVSLKNAKTLLEHSDVLNKVFPEFVLPLALLYIGNVLCGFSMEYVQGVMLSDYLNNPLISFGDKIKVLKEIGEFVDRFVDSNIFDFNYSLGDFHEDNIMIDGMGKIRIVDSNGCYLSINGVPNCKYLHELGDELPHWGNKYVRGGFIGEGDIIPTKDTDVLCYCMIIMNFISQCDFSRLSIISRENYLNYLLTIGFPLGFINCINGIYGTEQNINPKMFLNEITEEMWMHASYKEYCSLNKKQ